jgi:hypothetical protein
VAEAGVGNCCLGETEFHFYKMKSFWRWVPLGTWTWLRLRHVCLTMVKMKATSRCSSASQLLSGNPRSSRAVQPPPRTLAPLCRVLQPALPSAWMLFPIDGIHGPHLPPYRLRCHLPQAPSPDHSLCCHLRSSLPDLFILLALGPWDISLLYLFIPSLAWPHSSGIGTLSGSLLYHGAWNSAECMTLPRHLLPGSPP